MVQRMTPAQLRAAAQKAQRKQKRAIDNYNREVRNYNYAAKKAVDDFNRRRRDQQKRAIDDYNREVRTYNSRARAHNRQVQSQRHRIDQELARASSRPAATMFATYRNVTDLFVETYTAAESRLASTPGSPVDQTFLDLASDEAANSVYLVNALEGDGEPEEDLTEAELRAPSMGVQLAAFGADLVDRWTGALYALSPGNPDAARHFCTSAREVIVEMLECSAPDAEVKNADPGCEVTDKGVPTRKAKINYLLRRQGVTVSDLADVVEDDVRNVLALFRTFNDGTHGHAGRFSITELTAIRTRVESAIGFIHQVTAVPTGTAQ